MLSLNIAAFAQEKSKLSPLLDSYIGIKNALTTDDAAKAGTSAADYVKTLNMIDVKTSGSRTKGISAVKDKLLADANLIAVAKDINNQRDAFVGFSDNMIGLAKAAKLGTGDVFIEYCPMKKRPGLALKKSHQKSILRQRNA